MVDTSPDNHEGSPLPSGSDFDRERCLRYILSRQTPEGGFSFYRHAPWGIEEPNTSDTWAAITALRLLKQPIPQSELVMRWLQQQQFANGGYPTLPIGEAALYSLQQLGGNPLHNPTPFLMRHCLTRYAVQFMSINWPGWLDNTHRCLRLMVNQALPRNALRELVSRILSHVRASNGGYAQPGPSLIETWHALAIRCLLELDTDSPALDFVRQCENPLLGFTLVPQTSTTSLEVQLAGLHTLWLLSEQPRYPDAIKTFTTHCQSTSGGFARVPDALPGLQDTCRGLVVLSRLNDPPDPRIGLVSDERSDDGFC